MNEIILNIYLVINNNLVEAFKVVSYEIEGGDDRKIEFLKSVSYTHLRAHETVLDLVCRLLLEKKKNKVKKNKKKKIQKKKKKVEI